MEMFHHWYANGRRLGIYALMQSMLAPCWTEQHQHHHFRIWFEDIACYEPGVAIDDHLKIATVMNHLREAIQQRLLLKSTPITPWEEVRSVRTLINNFFSNNYIQQATPQQHLATRRRQHHHMMIRRKAKPAKPEAMAKVKFHFVFTKSASRTRTETDTPTNNG